MSSEAPKLSLVAQFDDMCRLTNSMVLFDENELYQLINKCEENRIKWLWAERQLALMSDKILKLEEEKKALEASLKHVRFSFGKEVQNREEILKQRNALKQQLNAIKEFVLEDPTTNQSQETKDKVLSYFNRNRLETVNEELPSNDSLSGCEYDTTEEDVLDESTVNRINESQKMSVSAKVEENQQTVAQQIAANFPNKTFSGVQSLPNTINHPVVAEEDVFKTNVDTESDAIKRNRSFSEPIPEKVSTDMRNPIKSDSTTLKPIPETVTNLQLGLISMSSPHMRRSNLKTFCSNSEELSPIHGTSLLEDRKHNLHLKKAFKPLYCSPCGKAIGFCGTCYRCIDCRAICHLSCKDQLPLPCIPFRKPNGKSSQMVLIADFAPQTRPMIPALIIHCCNEIERRGMKEEGIYRKSGSDKEVRELKEKILNSKSGMPGLAKYDIHAICGTVKLFLRHLDEPIVTRILWRDFVRAADQQDPDEEQALIMKTVSEMPTSNRDSLAFLMSHIIRVAQTEENLMDRKSLAKIFGPTIVGYSMIEPPMNELLAQNPKQIKVMEALMKISEESWNEIISSATLNQQNKCGGSPNRRQSVGTRLFGDAAKKGSLTPQRSTLPKRDSLSLKPLF